MSNIAPATPKRSQRPTKVPETQMAHQHHTDTDGHLKELLRIADGMVVNRFIISLDVHEMMAAAVPAVARGG